MKTATSEVPSEKSTLTHASRLRLVKTSPDKYQRFSKLNESIGSLRQLVISRIFILYVFGPILKLFLLGFFRLRVVGKENIPSGKKAIYASQHYYEWDPIVTFGSFLWAKRIIRPDLLPLLTAAPRFWGSSMILRGFSWLFSIIWFVPGKEPDGGCLGTVVRMMEKRKKFSVVIFPTGPIGRAKNYKVRYGVGWVARQCPDVPIIPIKVTGIQQLRLSDVLLLKRPLIHVRIGKSFFGREFIDNSNETGSNRKSEKKIVDRIIESWA